MSKPLAIVQDWMTGFAGGEQVLLALHEMYPDAPIYTSLHNPEKMPQFKNATVIPSYLQKFSYLRGHHQIAIPLMPLAFESFDLKEFDTVLSVGGGLSKGVITHPGQTHISYCHTPIRYIWRLGDDNRTEGWLRSRVAHRLRLWDVISAERPDLFLANSKTVKDRIGKIYRRDASVVYPPVDVERFPVATEAPGDYFLTVSRLVSYKRIDLVVEACIKAKAPLKVVGSGPEREMLMKLAADAPWIQFVGRVPEKELIALYQGARAFLFAAEEDFGIVPVEAMACGRPVIGYGRGGVTESVTEGLSGMLFPEQTIDSLVDTLTRFKDTDFEPNKIRTEAERFGRERFKSEMAGIIGIKPA